MNAVYYGSAGNLNQIDWSNIDLKNINLQIISNEGPIKWSFKIQGEIVRQSDIVLLPVNNDHEMTMYKGHNRPVDALRQGRLVITNAKIPSWLLLQRFIWCGDINEGIKWAINNPKEVKQKVKEGQSFVKNNFTPEIITKKWEKVYNVCDTWDS